MNVIFNFIGGHRSSLLRAAFVFLAAALALVATSSAARADKGDSVEVEAGRLVHILGYVAADYGGAVADGVVTNPDEYQEQLSLVGEAARIAERLATTAPSAGGEQLDVPAQVGKLKALLERKAPVAEVEELVAPLRTSLVFAFRLAEAPSAQPSALRGKALFAEHCSTCHGTTGAGDTARAASLQPRPANFLDSRIGEGLTPFRVAATVRFGVNGTAMVPFTFLSEADRWDLAFYVTGLRHAQATLAPAGPTYALSELAKRSDADLRADLVAAGVAADRIDGALADLRRRAPYEHRAGGSTLALARTKLELARVALGRGERDAARGLVVDAYLEGVEPAEMPLKAKDPALARAIEARFTTLRGRLATGAPVSELIGLVEATLVEVGRCETALVGTGAEGPAFDAFVKSATLLVREGVEAALLIAALLGLAVQVGLNDKRRYIHAGWLVAVVLGGVTFVASSRLVQISGASREMTEGVTALLATAVLFYVSWSLLAKREIARWMKFLREQVSPKRAAVSLFAISFIAAYREAFETVLFYQSLLAASRPLPVLAGIGAGAVLLTALVLAYTRAGRFAPPQIFFRVSGTLLYTLAVVFVGQGLAALQTAGVAPLHPLPIPSLPALGIYPTVETCAGQLLLVALAAYGAVAARRGAETNRPPSRVAATATTAGGESASPQV